MQILLLDGLVSNQKLVATPLLDEKSLGRGVVLLVELAA
ncbi:unannotated protein [freshwater metagenome]|uniref:Unannotated protein n=1 Tax=freshwater metagenome TaxID=449393 RepID=A0A6J7HPD1_9ZZZZ